MPGAIARMYDFGLFGVTPPPPGRSIGRSGGRAAFVALSPADPVLMSGGVVVLQARLVFGDLSGVDVTEEAAWSSSAPDVARVEGTPGRFLTQAPGIARVFASAGGKVGWTTITVLRSGHPSRG